MTVEQQVAVNEEEVQVIMRQGYSREQAKRLAAMMSDAPAPTPPAPPAVVPQPDPPRVTEVPPASADVRRWAKSKRIKVSASGRVSQDVVNAYVEAHRA